MTQNDCYHRPVKLEINNIRRFSRRDGLICAAQKCRQKLKVGDTIIAVHKGGGRRVAHYHEECYDSLFIGARKT